MEERNRVESVFTGLASAWGHKGRLISRSVGVRRRLREILGASLRPHLNVVDAGAGDGSLVAWILEVEPTVHVTAVESAPGMLRELRARFDNQSSVRIVNGDVTELHRITGEVQHDIVVLKQVLHHLDDPVAALQSASFALKPTGLLLAQTVGLDHHCEVIAPSDPDPLGRKLGSEWLSIVERAGLKAKVVFEDRFRKLFKSPAEYALFLHSIGSLEKMAQYRNLDGLELASALGEVEKLARMVEGKDGVWVTGHHTTLAAHPDCQFQKHMQGMERMAVA